MTGKHNSRRYNKKSDEKKGLTIGHLGVTGLACATGLAAFLRPYNISNSYVAEQFKNTPSITRPVQTQASKPVQPIITQYNKPSTTDYNTLVEKIREDASNIQPANYKNYLESSLERVLEQWYGTKWSMNGASQQPRKGSVGCDYLVIRALEALGYNFDKHELGWETITQNPTNWLASENIVKAASSQVREFWGMSYKNLKRYLNIQGNGIYALGTDTHVGFLQKKGNDLYFYHSSQRPHGKVVKEKADNVSTLKHSNVYVIGKLFTPDMYDRYFQKEPKPVSASGM